MASNTVIYSNVLAGVLFSALTPVFIQLSKTDGKIKYHPMEVSILVEMVKCAFSLASLQYARWQRGYEPEYGDNGVVLDQFDWKGSLPYLFPAFFYQLSNNLVFFIMMRMDPVTFQLLSNAEILAVAVLHRYYLGKILTLKQWMSLILLIDGVVSAELAGSKKLSAAGASGVSSAGVVQAVDSTRGAFKGGADDDFWEDVTKYSMVLCVALLRAFGGVGSEVAMKSTQDTLAFQNSHIYAWGVLSNIIFLAMHHGMMDVSLTGLEHLWHESSQNKGLWILLIVLNNSGQGLTVSVVFKYLNNIVKVYINSVALVLTTCISVYIFEFKVSAPFFLGGIVVFISAYIYNAEKAENEEAALVSQKAYHGIVSPKLQFGDEGDDDYSFEDQSGGLLVDFENGAPVQNPGRSSPISL